MLPPEAWPAAVASLAAVRDRGEPLSTSLVVHFAEMCGKSPRTLWRWVNQGCVPSYQRPSHELSQDELEAFARWHGNVAAVHRELYAGQPTAPTLRTLQRAFNKLSSAEHAMACRGIPARRERELNLTQSYTCRNELWIADHSQLNCLVLASRGTRPQRPWSTLFIDAATRTITGWVLSLQPTHSTVLAALRRAVLPKQDPDQRGICGRPEMLQTDNGLEFTAERVTAAMMLLGGSARTVRAYSPHLNGIVERLHRTMDTTWLAGEPFYSDAARQHNRQHTRPEGHLPPSFDEFIEQFAEWVRDYNCRHSHSQLDGQTPLEAWSADATPLVVPQESQLGWMLDAPVARKVQNYGIQLGNIWYAHPELHRYVDQTVDVRAPIHETHFIDVYQGSQRICRATPQDNWTADERREFIAGRRRSRRRMNQARRAATQAHVFTLNQRRAVEDPEEQARRDAATVTDGNLRRSSDTSLLGLETETDDHETATRRITENDAA